MPLRILGVDPGLADLGWAVVEVAGDVTRLVAHGAVSTKPADGTDLDRVVLIASAVQALIEDHAPHAVAVEPWVAVYAGKGANTTASHVLGCVLGAVRTVCAGARVRFIEGERAQGWRVALGLPRTAAKPACQERVRVVLGLSKVIRPQHASDAAAVAIVAARRGLR